ncbi:MULTISPECIES: helix-turn-helix transcriptional regulator [unclassified Bradyrhizobium]|uniref:helix-turn-helix transcriptional regulator n=1 Tax=unclassified Bradyrhizobium TaxID=2631580 RepID=UPI0039658190
MNIDNRFGQSQWLTRREAATYLRLGESTLAKLFVSGEGPPAIKVGRSVRYASDDLDTWMGARRRRSTSDNGSVA